jgi:hypothetical protein
MLLMLQKPPRIYLPCTHQQTQTCISPSQNKSQKPVQPFQPSPVLKKQRLKVHAGMGVGHKCHVHTQPTTTITSTTTPTPAPGRRSNKKEKPDVGLEPTTLRLRVSRATDCASRACCEEKLLLDFDEDTTFYKTYILAKILKFETARMRLHTLERLEPRDMSMR